MIKRLPFELQRMPVIQDKVNEIIDWINRHEHKTRAENVQPAPETRPVNVSELAYLQKENSDLKDEVELLQKKLDIAIDALDCIVNGNCHMRNTAKRALDQIKGGNNE
jgi:hypothetical protein